MPSPSNWSTDPGVYNSTYSWPNRKLTHRLQNEKDIWTQEDRKIKWKRVTLCDTTQTIALGHVEYFRHAVCFSIWIRANDGAKRWTLCRNHLTWWEGLGKQRFENGYHQWIDAKAQKLCLTWDTYASKGDISNFGDAELRNVEISYIGAHFCRVVNQVFSDSRVVDTRFVLGHWYARNAHCLSNTWSYTLAPARNKFRVSYQQVVGFNVTSSASLGAAHAALERSSIV